MAISDWSYELTLNNLSYTLWVYTQNQCLSFTVPEIQVEPLTPFTLCLPPSLIKELSTYPIKLAVGDLVFCKEDTTVEIGLGNEQIYAGSMNTHVTDRNVFNVTASNTFDLDGTKLFKILQLCYNHSDYFTFTEGKWLASNGDKTIIYLSDDGWNTLGIDLTWHHPKFFYSLLSKQKLTSCISIGYTDHKIDGSTTIELKLTNRELIPIQVAYHQTCTDCSDEQVLLNRLQTLQQEEVILTPDLEKINRILNNLEEKGESPDSLMFFTSKQKIKVSEFIRLFRKNEQIQKVSIAGNVLILYLMGCIMFITLYEEVD